MPLNSTCWTFIFLFLSAISQPLARIFTPLSLKRFSDYLMSWPQTLLTCGQLPAFFFSILYLIHLICRLHSHHICFNIHHWFYFVLICVNCFELCYAKCSEVRDDCFYCCCFHRCNMKERVDGGYLSPFLSLNTELLIPYQVWKGIF